MSRQCFQIYLVLSGFTLATRAYQAFETTCTKPPNGTNFVSSPDSRGTLDILWSSLFTIVLCTWTIQHLNIPEQREGRDPGLMGDIKWKLKGTYTSAKWMLVTILAPEMIMAKAMFDLEEAKYYLKRFQEFALEDQVPWSLAHMYYTNMGGFVIRDCVGSNVILGPHIAHTTPKTKPSEVLPKTFINGDNQTSNQQDDEAMAPDNSSSHIPSTGEHEGVADVSSHHLFHLDADCIIRLRLDKFLPKLPNISIEELNDKSKGDPFIKAIAVVQICWALLQILVRAGRKLTFSQLELMVIAFTSCAVIIYFLYWTKPKNIQTTTTILQYQGQIPPTVMKRIEIFRDDFAQSILLFGRDSNKARQGDRIRNDNFSSSSDKPGFILLGAIGAVLFGGIHIAAWNFEFPSRIELIFWRCASVYATAFMPILLLAAANLSDRILDIVMSSLSVAYIISRLFLLVETFRTLCFLSPNAYVSTWATNVPHVA